LQGIESRTSFSVGLFAEYQLSDKFGVSLDALYVQEGAMRMDPRYVYYQSQLSWTNASLTLPPPHDGDTYYLSKVNTNVVMNNFEFPVLLNYYLPATNGLQPKLFLGGSFDYIYRVQARNLLAVSHENLWNTLNVYGQDFSQYQAYVLPKRETDDITHSFEYYNVGVVGGAGVTFKAFSLELRYKVGMMPINNLATYKVQNSYKENFSSNTLFVTFGIKLNKL
jgi:hypothetical protein